MNLGLKKNEVKLVPFDNSWQDEFLKNKQKILKQLNIEDKKIEHIGSTAIKSIYAKPVIDILIGVESLGDITELTKQLKLIEFYRLRVVREDEIVFAKFTDKSFNEKTHFIHLVEYNGELWKDFLFFRDYLNSHKSAKEEYEKIKLDFTTKQSTGIIEYTDTKEIFVKKIIQKRKE